MSFDVFDERNVIVVKIGSSTLVDGTGEVDHAFIACLCDQVGGLAHHGYRLIVISSGAVAAGFRRLGLTERPTDTPSLQACASAGQALLIDAYAQELARHGLGCGQVLLTRRDLADRQGYLNARNTLGRLLELGSIPIVNENDTVSVAEFTFGDNDMLGAIVSASVNADLYVILSDVDGLYSANPSQDPSARIVRTLDHVDARVESMAGGTGSLMGTGGMRSKLRAARLTLAAGVPTVICRGRQEGILSAVVRGEAVGTRIEGPCMGEHERARKLWLASAEVPHGSLTLDEGAREAVCSEGASVLPVGIARVAGGFSAGDVIDVLATDGTLLGRGISAYDARDLRRFRGLKLGVIERFLDGEAAQPAIHRDNLLVF